MKEKQVQMQCPLGEGPAEGGAGALQCGEGGAGEVAADHRQHLRGQQHQSCKRRIWMFKIQRKHSKHVQFCQVLGSIFNVYLPFSAVSDPFSDPDIVTLGLKIPHLKREKKSEFI